ncbi:LLM class flavin-dependent oxidoreductase [Micrococcus porci]|uniref:LLM class flavin-dependent oxidoreductase n=1 Tax=Micrococcus porci TaxID=2856555 RepID=UPI001CCC2401|nr:LLM class flavin-dependent oxidoreductase [Micrococcus porci]UBH24423.1 LLM class flavin-dependent oxidoreductase [Micrococcus porci]
MTTKNLGFLNFGHWIHRPRVGRRPVEPDAKQAIDDVVQMAVDAEAAGLDGAWIRIHHFQRMFSSPFPILTAMAAHTERIHLGTGVIDLRYENPLYMAEAAATTDLLAGGRLELGVSRGSPEAARDGQAQFGYELADGQTWSDVARERGRRLLAGVRGEGIATPDLSSGWAHSSAPLRIEPHSPGLADRIWWGSGTVGSAVEAAKDGYGMLSSTLLLQDDGRPFHVQQADQIARYLEAYEAGGHTTPARTAVTRSAFVIQDHEDELYFGRDRHSRDSSGHLDGGAARSGPTYAGSAEEVAELLAADDAVQAADWVLFANPNQLGAEYNAKLFAGWAEVWRLLGWDS